jgi:hypothetical protein
MGHQLLRTKSSASILEIKIESGLISIFTGLFQKIISGGLPRRCSSRCLPEEFVIADFRQGITIFPAVETMKKIFHISEVTAIGRKTFYRLKNFGDTNGFSSYGGKHLREIIQKPLITIEAVSAVSRVDSGSISKLRTKAREFLDIVNL